MSENNTLRKAFAVSFLLHCAIILIVASWDPFSFAEPSSEEYMLMEVSFYDGDGDISGAGSSGEVLREDAVNFPDDPVLQEDYVVQEQGPVQSRPVRRRTAAAVGNQGRAGGDSSGNRTAGSGTGHSSGTGVRGGGGAGNAPPPPPPRERVEASLRSEAAPDYPQELIDDDIEGAVTIMILVAADGSVEDVSVTSSSGFRAMDRAAIAAGWRFQFNPGDNGRRGIWTKTFRFQLN